MKSSMQNFRPIRQIFFGDLVQPRKSYTNILSDGFSKQPYIKENMNTMLVASSALSVCADSMHYSTGTEPKLCQLFVV